jgi:outer membrane protein OmpA-like peptidoglycan-associated protein
MKKIITYLFLIVGICAKTNAQEKVNHLVIVDTNSINSTPNFVEKSSKEIKGDKFAFRYSFDKAIISYSNTKELTPEGQRKLAESYHNMNQNIESEESYAKLISKQTGVVPDDYYNYSAILKINGKYDESNKWMEKFGKLKPYDLRALDYKANKNEFEYLSGDIGRYKIENLNINTSNDDFGTSYYKDQIVFTSSETRVRMIKRRYNWNNEPFWSMYISEVDGNQLTKPKKTDSKFNGKMHDGPVSFSKDGSIMAFTRNNYKDKTKDKIVELQIYFSTNTEGKWSEPESFILNNGAYSVGHPCLSDNGQTMYFTSDMPGGFGGADIYRISKSENGSWGKAENMGNKINTEGDEMFPFYEETNNLLFFTSNGRFGLGGLDVFICPLNGTKTGSVYNAGSPLNTQYDDFSFIISESLKTGYLSSNRTGGSGRNDIYFVDILKPLEMGKKIEGIAKDSNNNPLAQTFITIFDENDEIIDTLTTTNDASFAFLVDSDKNYKLMGEKEEYNEGRNIANTFSNEFIVEADVILVKESVIVPETVEVVAEKLPVETDHIEILEINPSNIYFDYGLYNIRPDAISEIDFIVKLMNDNPNMIVELGSHTDCRANDEFNQRLSERRAKSSVDYIKKRISKPERISGKGYGETQLVNKCKCKGDVVSECTEEQHQKNRRTEFIIISN